MTRTATATATAPSPALRGPSPLETIQSSVTKSSRYVPPYQRVWCDQSAHSTTALAAICTLLGPSIWSDSSLLRSRPRSPEVLEEFLAILTRVRAPSSPIARVRKLVPRTVHSSLSSCSSSHGHHPYRSTSSGSIESVERKSARRHGKKRTTDDREHLSSLRVRGSSLNSSGSSTTLSRSPSDDSSGSWSLVCEFKHHHSLFILPDIPTIASPPIQEAAEGSHSPPAGSSDNSGAQSPSLLFMSSGTQDPSPTEHVTDVTSMHVEP